MKRNPLSMISIRRAILILFVCFISMSIMAQKVNLYTLNIDQLTVYKEKAVKERNTGMRVTFTGVGIAAAGYIASVIWSATTSLEDFYVFRTLIPAAIGAYVGIPTAIFGVCFWINGGIRKSKAEIALKKFDFKTNNSMAVGLGITLRF